MGRAKAPKLIHKPNSQQAYILGKRFRAYGMSIVELWNRSRSAGACAACRSIFFKIDRIHSFDNRHLTFKDLNTETRKTVFWRLRCYNCTASCKPRALITLVVQPFPVSRIFQSLCYINIEKVAKRLQDFRRVRMNVKSDFNNLVYAIAGHFSQWLSAVA